MASILVLHGTGADGTVAVAERVAATLDDCGHDATPVDAAALPSDLGVDDFDAVLVGASIHAGEHRPAVRAFVEAHRDALAARPTGFFQVSRSPDRPDERDRATVAGDVESFLAAADWDPDRIAVLGGALRYAEHGFVERLVIKRIARRPTGDADDPGAPGDTDRAAAEAFAGDFASFVEERLGDAGRDDVPGADG